MRGASNVRLKATTLKKCGLSHSDCRFEEDQNKCQRYLTCVATTGRSELVFFLVFKTSAGTSDEVGCGDCHHVCDDEESHHEGLDESFHVR